MGPLGLRSVEERKDADLGPIKVGEVLSAGVGSVFETCHVKWEVFAFLVHFSALFAVGLLYGIQILRIAIC